MTNNWALVVILMFLVVSGLFGYYAGIGDASPFGSERVAHLTPKAIEVLEANGYEVPESAKTGIVTPDTKDWKSALGFMFRLATFDVPEVPFWFSTLYMIMTLVLIYLGLKLISGFIPTTGGSGSS